jgi:hypothetical protein
MPLWSTTPPDPHEFATIRLMRVPQSGSLLGLITSEEVLGCYTHWDTYRTQPCPGDGCPLCLDGQPKRWQGYLSLQSQSTQKQVVVQITALAAQQLQQEKARYGHIRGLLADFSRVAKRPNARILVQCRQLPQPPLDLVQPVNIPKYMALIWQSNGELK